MFVVCPICLIQARLIYVKDNNIATKIFVNAVFHIIYLYYVKSGKTVNMYKRIFFKLIPR